MDVIAAYERVGSYRGAAELCGVDPKTVKRKVLAREAGELDVCLVGPAGTGKTHYLIGLGRAAVAAGYKVRYFTAIDLVEHLYRAVADNTVGKAIEAACRNDLIVIDEIGFAPLDHTGCQLLFRLVSAAYERRSIAIASHTPFEQWGKFLPDQPTACRRSSNPAVGGFGVQVIPRSGVHGIPQWWGAVERWGVHQFGSQDL